MDTNPPMMIDIFTQISMVVKLMRFILRALPSNGHTVRSKEVAGFTRTSPGASGRSASWGQ